MPHKKEADEHLAENPANTSPIAIEAVADKDIEEQNESLETALLDVGTESEAKEVIATNKKKTVKQRWYRNKTASRVTNYISQTLFIVDTVVNLVGKYPLLQFVTVPIDGFLKIISYGLWRTSLLLDPKIDLEKNNDKRNFFIVSKWFEKFSAYFGCVSGVAILVSIFVPVAAPILLLVAASSLCISNAFLACGQISELIQLIKYAPDNGTRGLTIAAQTSRIVYSSFGTLSMALFTAALVVSVAFPPAGAALLAASIATAIISGIGFVSSCALDFVVAKKTKAMANTAKTEQVEIEPTNPLEKNKPVLERQHELVNKTTTTKTKERHSEPAIDITNDKAKQCVTTKSHAYTPLASTSKQPTHVLDPLATKHRDTLHPDS